MSSHIILRGEWFSAFFTRNLFACKNKKSSIGMYMVCIKITLIASLIKQPVKSTTNWFYQVRWISTHVNYIYQWSFCISTMQMTNIKKQMISMMQAQTIGKCKRRFWKKCLSACQRGALFSQPIITNRTSEQTKN